VGDMLVFVLALCVLVVLVLVVEIVAATVPMLIVITMVPPDEREALARLLAAADSSRRLRLWPALRAAATARQSIRRAAVGEPEALSGPVGTAPRP
jgi:hypothetical protein